MQHIDTVRSVNGHSTASGYKTNDLISRYRVTALGKTYCHIIDTFNHNAALGFADADFLFLRLTDGLHDLRISDRFLLRLLILFQHLVHDLALFQTAMSDGCKNRLPVAEAVFTENTFLVFRFDHLCLRNSLHLTVLSNHFLALHNVLFLEFRLKPLIDLILCLGTLDNVQPVAARPLRVLGRNDLNPVAIFNHIVNRHQFSVNSGTNHFISNRTVNAVGKVNGVGAVGQSLHVTARRKTVHALREQVKITL